MHVHVHAANGRASCAPSFGLFLRPLAAPQGPHFGGILPQKRSLVPFAPAQSFYIRERLQRRSAGMHGFVHNRRRSRRRASQAGREKPEGSRRWIAAIAKQYMDVLSEQPRLAEKRRAVRFARCESDRRVRCLAFLVTFWAMPKRNRLARRARRSFALESRVKVDSRLPGNHGKEEELDLGLRRNDELRIAENTIPTQPSP